MKLIKCIRTCIKSNLSFFHIALFIISGTLVVVAQSTKIQIPKEKQTTLGLYVTSKEAFEKWKGSLEKVKILDVRTAEEYLFVGHASMAWNIPIFFQSYEWDTLKQKFPMKPNPDFITAVKKIFTLNDTILVTCRSGGRSAMAVNLLAKEGFKNVFNITDGFEGDVVDDSESVFDGQRMKNGWKNSGLPYTYIIDLGLMLK
jgi:rhodanese-related sulfurtransferase